MTRRSRGQSDVEKTGVTESGGVLIIDSCLFDLRGDSSTRSVPSEHPMNVRTWADICKGALVGARAFLSPVGNLVVLGAMLIYKHIIDKDPAVTVLVPATP